MDEQLGPNVSQKDNALIGLRYCEDSKVAHPLCTKLLDDFDELELQVIDLQP